MPGDRVRVSYGPRWRLAVGETSRFLLIEDEGGEEHPNRIGQRDESRSGLGVVLRAAGRGLCARGGWARCPSPALGNGRFMAGNGCFGVRKGCFSAASRLLVERAPGFRFEVRERPRILEGEDADARAPQGRQMRAAPQSLAEVARKRTHIRSRGALHLDIDIDHPDRPIGAVEHRASQRRDPFETADRHPVRRQLDLHALADQRVSPLPRDPLRRHGRRDLIDRAPQLPHRRLERALVNGPAPARLDQLALRIIAQSRRAEADRRRVRLLMARDPRQQTGRLPDSQDENTGRHRIERARMTHLAGMRHPPHT